VVVLLLASVLLVWFPSASKAARVVCPSGSVVAVALP